jgi:hypothetical protein
MKAFEHWYEIDTEHTELLFSPSFLNCYKVIQGKNMSIESLFKDLPALEAAAAHCDPLQFTSNAEPLQGSFPEFSYLFLIYSFRSYAMDNAFEKTTN